MLVRLIQTVKGRKMDKSSLIKAEKNHENGVGHPSSPAPLPAADLLRILEEKDQLISHQEAELAKQQALLKA